MTRHPLCSALPTAAPIGANERFTNPGATPLIAPRTAIGPWEQFDLITN